MWGEWAKQLRTKAHLAAQTIYVPQPETMSRPIRAIVIKPITKPPRAAGLNFEASAISPMITANIATRNATPSKMPA